MTWPFPGSLCTYLAFVEKQSFPWVSSPCYSALKRNVEILTLRVKVLGGRIFGGDWIMRVGPHEWPLCRDKRLQRAPCPSTTRGHSKNTVVCEPGSRLSADAGSTGALIMGPSSLQSCEKYMSVVYKLPALVFCYTSPNRLKHWPRSSCQTVLVLNAVGSF